MADKIREMDVDVIVGPAMGGIVYAYELARQTGKRAIFTERVDNVMTLKRFAIHPGEKCLIAEDVVTTGISSLETKRVIEEPAASAWASPAWWTAPSPRLRLPFPSWQAPQAGPAQLRTGRVPHLQGRQAAAGASGSRKMKQEAKQTL